MELSYGCTEQGHRLIKRTRKDAENIFGQPERIILFEFSYDSVHVNPTLKERISQKMRTFFGPFQECI